MNDRRLYTAPTLSGGMSWDYDENWWMVFIVDAEFVGASQAAPCRATRELPDHCYDASILAGVRFRQTPSVVSGVRPFVNFLLGRYWQGSGTDEMDDDKDQKYISSHFAMQLGGGVDIRWPGSFQGIRVSVDVRRVFAADRQRRQIRLLGSYVLGPRRFKTSP